MAEPRTQDLQKVSNSATKNIVSYADAVQVPGLVNKNVELIYENMAKLFDVFTNGVLLGQAANSEILLRTIYRGLDDKFLDIVQNSDFTTKVAELMKEKMDGVPLDNAESAPVSETTKKVVTQTLDPYDYDQFQVITDFTDELYTDILQVKQDLTKQYERQRLEYLNAYKQQQDRFAEIDKEFQEQDNSISEKLQGLSSEDILWKKQAMERTQSLLELFDEEDVNKQFSDISIDGIVEDGENIKKNLSRKNDRSEFNVGKLLSKVNGRLVEIEPKVIQSRKTLIQKQNSIQRVVQNIKKVHVVNRTETIVKHVDVHTGDVIQEESTAKVQVKDKSKNQQSITNKQTNSSVGVVQPVQETSKPGVEPKPTTPEEVKQPAPVGVADSNSNEIPEQHPIIENVSESIGEPDILPDVEEPVEQKVEPVEVQEIVEPAPLVPVTPPIVPQPYVEQSPEDVKVFIGNDVHATVSVDKTETGEPIEVTLDKKYSEVKGITKDQKPIVVLEPIPPHVIATPDVTDSQKQIDELLSGQIEQKPVTDRVNQVTNVISEKPIVEDKGDGVGVKPEPLPATSQVIPPPPLGLPQIPVPSPIGVEDKTSVVPVEPIDLSDIPNNIQVPSIDLDEKVLEPPKDEQELSNEIDRISHNVPTVPKIPGNKGDKQKQPIESPIIPPTPSESTVGDKLRVSPSPVPIDKVQNKISGDNKKPSDTKLPMVQKPKSFPIAPQQPPQPQQGSGSQIDQNGVTNALSKIHGNVTKMVSDDKFKRYFMLDYEPLQKNIQQNMQKINKDETSICKDLIKAEKNQISAQKGGNRGGFLGKMLLGGALKIVFITIGGLILITLARIAFRAWAKEYMPPSEPGTFTLFGIPIPFVNDIKAFFIGIKNFIFVGLPNIWDRLKLWYKGIKDKLFGKDGMFSSSEETFNTLRKIGMAYIMGLTKKFQKAGWKALILAIGFALNFVLPGASGIANIIAEFVPELLYSLTNYFMRKWSNAKADSETRFKDMQKQMKTSVIRQKLKDSSKGVKLFGNPKQIPGMQYAAGGGGSKPHEGAIMNHVGGRMTAKNKGFLKENALRSREEDQKKDEERFKSEDPKSILYQLSTNDGDEGTKLESGFFLGDFNSQDEINNNADVQKEKSKQICERIITPQVNMIDNYIKQLEKSTRFQNVKGTLYDVQYGWNPGYRVQPNDLLTPIPLTPFEPVHNKNDIQFGDPPVKSEEYKGYLPFGWRQDGQMISANPILFELQRAYRIRNIWADMAEDIIDEHGRWFTKWDSSQENIVDEIFPKYAEKWRDANSVVLGDYDDDVYYGDKFVNFFNKLMSGKIDEKDNNMNRAQEENAEPSFWDTGWGTATKIAGRVALSLVTMGGSEIAMAAFKIGSVVADKVGKIADNIKADLSYDDRGEGVFGNLMAGANSYIKMNGFLFFDGYNDYKVNGHEYGDIADMMRNDGILELFSHSQITAPIDHANALIQAFMDDDIISESKDKSGNPPQIHHLMSQFFDRVGIKGYSWENAKDDKLTLAGFSQSFLEYIGTQIIPEWQNVQALLKDNISGGKTTEKQVNAGLEKFLQLFDQNKIFDFFDKYIRFGQLNVRVVDYSNATSKERILIDAFKRKLGIPDDKQKKQNLKFLNSQKQNTLKDIDKLLGISEKMRERAAFESKAIGEVTPYLTSINDFYVKLLDKRNKLAGADQDGSKVKVSPNGVEVQKTVENVKKTPEQIQKEKEEQKKRDEERQKQEEEKKRKAEEEKRKQEEADRKLKEEAVIAEAKIKAMENIRKQEQQYETVLEKMINNPGKVTDEELKQLDGDVDKLKQEAENRINQLPREEREAKLALIRGDKVSEKTFTELKETAAGLSGSLEAYIGEVRKIPSGSIVAVQKQEEGKPTVLQETDPDNIDLGFD